MRRSSPLKTLIENATVVLPEGCQRVSVLIAGEKIAAVDPAAHSRVAEM